VVHVNANAQDKDRREEDPVGHGEYGPGALDEVTPPSDPVREAKQRDIEDPADVDAEPGGLRDGGPVGPRGAITTTGGKAGPASVHRRTRRPGGNVAPTTTGDATSGGMTTPAGGSTSDAAGGGSSAGNFTDR
jgi:hypothetical protein